MFRWRYVGGNDQDVGASQAFQSREAAEAWLSESWSNLSDEGVDEVTLVEEPGATEVYRMALSPDQGDAG